MKKIRLASDNTCTGCGVCVASCTHKALSLNYDKNGFLRPIFNEKNCIQCKLCMQNCPVLHPETIKLNSHKSSISYTVWSKNEDICKNSTSGGFFSQLAIDFLSQDNSFVYGAYLDKNNTCYHVEINQKKNIYKIRGTKYIPSNVAEAYKKAKQRLKEGGSVLFSGTPCQIAGLYNYIPKLLHEKLFTAEVICHGMPSKLISDITCKHYGGGNIVSYRNKYNGWKRGIQVIINQNGKEIHDKKNIFCFSEADNLSCYRCFYAQINRVADITMGDNWNLYDKKDLYNPLGISLILINTSKGKHIIEKSKLIILPFEKKELNSPLLFMPNKYRYFFNISRWIGRLQNNHQLTINIIKHNWRKNIFLLPYAICINLSRKFYSYKIKQSLKKFQKNINNYEK